MAITTVIAINTVAIVSDFNGIDYLKIHTTVNVYMYMYVYLNLYDAYMYV